MWAGVHAGVTRRLLTRSDWMKMVGCIESWESFVSGSFWLGTFAEPLRGSTRLSRRSDGEMMKIPFNRWQKRQIEKLIRDQRAEIMSLLRVFYVEGAFWKLNVQLWCRAAPSPPQRWVIPWWWWKEGAQRSVSAAEGELGPTLNDPPPRVTKAGSKLLLRDRRGGRQKLQLLQLKLVVLHSFSDDSSCITASLVGI